MEGIWTELAPLDPWETSVLSGAYLFAEIDALNFRSGLWQERHLVR